MRVFVENLRVVARHGIYDDERAEGRLYAVDFSVEVADATSDTITDTVNYCALAEIAERVAGQQQHKLVETIARKMIDDVFEEFEVVHSAEVTVRKRASGVPGAPEWVGVSMTKTRRKKS